jgi:glycosyltransferase involved in cell wall biosynthesis
MDTDRTTLRNGDGDPLKVAYIIGTYPLLTTTFIEQEVEVLHQIGMHIRVFSIRRPPAEVSAVPRYVDMQKNVTYLLPVQWVAFVLAHLYFALLRPIVYVKLLAFLITRPHPTLGLHLKTVLHFAEGVYAAYLLRSENCDRVHAHFVDRAATVALCISRLLGVPYSLTAHANDIYTQQALVGEKIAESAFSITVSEFNKVYLLKRYPHLNPDDIVVLHPWVDLAYFQPPDVRSDSARLRIISVGRLVEKKGHHHLIEACHLLRQSGVDFECHILGSGPLRSELANMIARYGLSDRVQIIGGRARADVLARMRQSDLFVLACVIARDGDRDGIPVALAEAMAMELPVISTDIGGIGELVRPGVGFLVSPNNPPALAEAIRVLHASGGSIRKEMGKRGRTIVAEHFELFSGTRRLADLFTREDQWRKRLPGLGAAQPRAT